MHRITFYPVGNADCSTIDLENGKCILVDFGDERDPEDDSDKRINLAAALREDLSAANRSNFDVVAFTHLDRDHICRATEFFYLEHAKKYQHKDRIKIGTLWVPAAALFEENLEDEAKIIQQEARYRFRSKKGIRVFSRPERLKDWIEGQGMSFDETRMLITNAGQVVPDFSESVDAVEFFVHSPFAEHGDDRTLIDRNECSLVFQATFNCSGAATRLVLGSDTTHEVWASIVKQTQFHENEIRLAWDIFKLPHHCSYLSLGPEKGSDVTEPVPEVKWIFEDRGGTGSVMVSTSKPIPSNDDDDQPPHRQAANYYKQLMKTKDGEFVVTMEHPTESKPSRLIIEIGGNGPKVKKTSFGSGPIISSGFAPRAGW
jgi:hypothetical protein